MKSLLIESLTEIKHYLKQGKSMFVICGNINDLFPYGKKLLPLAECVANEFKDQFKVVHFDVFNGFSGNLNIFEKASYDPATSEFRDNEYERLNLQINTLINQVPKMDKALKQTDYKMMIIITMAHQVVNRNSTGRERFYPEMWASQPEYGSSGNVVVLLTPNPNDLPLESCGGTNCATIQVKLPEDRQIEYLLMTRNVLNEFNLFAPEEIMEYIQSLRGLKYREIIAVIKAKQDAPEHSFKDIVEEFRYGIQRINNPVENIKKRLLDLEKYLLRNIKGQDEAINKICKAIIGKFWGIGESKGPLVILLLGQTGTGKSQSAKEIAKWLYGSEESLKRYSMQEFMHESDAARLLGAPPGYIGYTDASLAKAVRDNPYAVILFDEMEKAHGKIQNVLLGIIDDGFLRDNQDNIVSFKNATIFLTTNLLTPESLSGKFSSEFINRISLVVQYEPLPKEICEQILEDKLQNVIEDAARDDLSLGLYFTKETKKHLLEIGFDPRRNARELDRVVKREIKNKLVDLKINGRLKKNDIIEFDISAEKDLKISIRKNNNLQEEKNVNNQLRRTNGEFYSKRSGEQGGALGTGMPDPL